MIHWIIELILGPRPNIQVRAHEIDKVTQRTMDANREAMRLRLDVLTRGKGKP